MPTQEHDVSAELFRWSPMLAAELLTEMGVPLAEVRQARDVSESFTDLKTKEYTADAAIVLETTRGRTGVVVEIQRKRAEDKRWTWPLYLATLRNRQRCPTVLLVIAPDPAVAQWCGIRIDTGHPGHTLTPLVLGPEHVPLMKDGSQIAADPAMGVLSALFHGTGEHQANVLRSAFDGANKLAETDEEHAHRYYEYVQAVLPEAARKTLEIMMQTESPYYDSFLARAAVKGEAKGLALAVIRNLENRGIGVSQEERERVLGCTDTARLDAWLERSLTVQTAAEIFGRDDE
ncbi:hypothetical protein [Actinomadura sp. K4S16]|uniref:hypothetical protein n=1 Tax=Actinomadura sp. K4S16 TaxID=1316147 RepID=UPI0011EDE05E|nr:hypothetical protein [Actinomadura sp. K4S16]